jgi:hypothetical protein
MTAHNLTGRATSHETTDLTFTIPACPPWCTQPAGHPYVESTTEGYPARSHWGDGAKAWPARFETIQGDRIVTVGAWVTIVADDDDQLTPAEARALASELVRAADAIDQG